jgi:uncharacterized protein with FMN-binding domain
MRRALAVLAVTVAVVVWLARYETHPPRTLNANSALRDPAAPAAAAARTVPETAGEGEAQVRRRSGVPAGAPGTRSAAGPVVSTPFSVIQVRATLRGRRLVGVETVALSGSDPHTEALNARAEPRLRERALAARGADVDAVSGATYTSESWQQSLQAAITAARRG